MKDISYMTLVNGKMKDIPSIDDLCLILQEKFNKMNKQINYWQEKYNELKNEKWKDKELQEMEKELNKVKADAARGFSISKEEYDAAIDWMNKHELAKHYDPNRYTPRGGAIGGSYTWLFVPTGIGTFGTIRCSCGEEFTFQEEA